MIKQVTSKNTKAEIIDVHEQLLSEHKKLQQQIENLKKMKTELPQQGSIQFGKGSVQTTPALEKMKKEQNMTAKQSIDDIVHNLNAIMTTFGGALNELSSSLVAEASKLGILQNQAELELKNLEQLHGIKPDDNTLQKLIPEYREKQEIFKKEIEQKRESVEQELLDLKKNWEKEKDTNSKSIKERDENFKQSLDRNKAEYEYQTKLSRKVNEEEYAEKQNQLQKELAETMESVKSELKARESKIMEQETEFNLLSQRIENFNKELNTAIEKSRKEKLDKANKQIKVKSDLRDAEIKSENKIYELKIQSLEETIKNQSLQIKNIAIQLDNILKQTQSLAVKAIESTSNFSSLQSIKEIAMEQAKNVKKEN